jgi:hypothetical protein
MGHDLAVAMAADLAAPDAAVAERFGVCGVEVPAATARAADAAFIGVLGAFVHRRLLRCSSAKLTRLRLAGAGTDVPIKTAPCIEAATAQPTRQSNQ